MKNGKINGDVIKSKSASILGQFSNEIIDACEKLIKTTDRCELAVEFVQCVINRIAQMQEKTNKLR